MFLMAARLMIGGPTFAALNSILGTREVLPFRDEFLCIGNVFFEIDRRKFFDRSGLASKNDCPFFRCT